MSIFEGVRSHSDPDLFWSRLVQKKTNRGLQIKK
jgi:hypothetical protein